MKSLNGWGSIHHVLKAKQRNQKQNQGKTSGKIIFREKVIQLQADEVSRTEEFVYQSMKNVHEVSQERGKLWEKLQT